MNRIQGALGAIVMIVTLLSWAAVKVAWVFAPVSAVFLCALALLLDEMN